jgi:plastocyanin
MPRPRATMLALIAVAAVLLAGCGRTRVVGQGRAVNMALSEYRLHPASIRVSAGRLMFYVHNYGRLSHDLVVAQDGQTIGQTKPLPPGQTAELALDLAPGRYSMISTMRSDQALGAYGTLEVSQ